jgi:hypothetical protein
MSKENILLDLQRLQKFCAEIKKQYTEEPDPKRKMELKVQFHIEDQKRVDLQKKLEEYEKQKKEDVPALKSLTKPNLKLPPKPKPQSPEDPQSNANRASYRVLNHGEVNSSQIVSSIESLSIIEQSDGTAFAPLTAIAAGAKIGKAIVELGGLLLLWVVRGLIAPAEMLFRVQFGERYHNALITASMFAIYAGAPMFLGFPEIFVMIICGFLFIRLWVNTIHCFIRDRRGEYWHSYSEGISIMRLFKVDGFFANLNFTFEASVLFLEPIAFIILGLIGMIFLEPDFSFENPITYDDIELNRITLWFFSLGLTSFFYQFYCFFYRRNLLLNEMDEEVLAEARLRAKSEPPQPGLANFRGVTYLRKGTEKKDWGK